MEVGATQYVGSQSQQPILLHQPTFEIISKRVFKRSGRGEETEYLVSFTGCAAIHLSKPAINRAFQAAQ